MHARSEPPHHQSRLASGRRILAPPPGLDLRYGKNSNPCVNRFQSNFLSELVLHYRIEPAAPAGGNGNCSSSLSSILLGYFAEAGMITSIENVITAMVLTACDTNCVFLEFIVPFTKIRVSANLNSVL